MNSSDSTPTESHPPGTLRYKDKDGALHVTCPHDPMYSTVTMLATEYWSPTARAWISLNTDDDANTSSFST